MSNTFGENLGQVWILLVIVEQVVNNKLSFLEIIVSRSLVSCFGNNFLLQLQYVRGCEGSSAIVFSLEFIVVIDERYLLSILVSIFLLLLNLHFKYK